MFMRITTILFLVDVANTSPYLNNSSIRQVVDYRLNHDVEPTSYEIDFRLNADFVTTHTFTIVKEMIMLKVNTPVSEFRLHYALHDTWKDDSIVLQNMMGFEIPITWSLNEINQQLTITSTTQLLDPSQSYALSFHQITGDLRSDMYGFYLSEYISPTGTAMFVASTHMQPVHTRKAFPCFDDPSFKAEFTLSIIRPVDYVITISNTRGRPSGGVIGGNLEKIQFEKTPEMSAYLIAFVVSKFRWSVGSNINYRVFHPDGFQDSTQYALSVTAPMVAAMEEKTGIAYGSMGIEQLYQVAMPDFPSGAMENWGLAIYRERNLLWNSKESSNRQKQVICAVIAHEISHMWFGDYVTTNWWSETWLNEGFATFFEAKATDMVEPAWKMMEQFAVDDLQPVMAADAILGSWPLTSMPEQVATPNQISAKFTSISYSKGASIIRMMEHFIGEQKFYSGLNDYLTTNAYGNTLPDDLWSSFQKQNIIGLPTGATVKDVMTFWTERAGFPVVTVRKSGNNALLSQSRFLLNTGTDTTKWYVPISYATSKVNTNFQTTSPQHWLLPSADLTISNVFENNDWMMVNIQETGFYRVDYEEDLWRKMADLLKSNHRNIHEINRAQLIDDVMNLARVQNNKYGIALDITKYLEEETDYLPWFSAFTAFGYLRRRFDPSDEVYRYLQDYIMRMSNKLYQSVSFIIDNNDHLHTLKTVLSLQWACNIGHEECKLISEVLFNSYRTSELNSINPNLRSIVYCDALRSNNPEDWNFLFSKLGGFGMSTEKVTIISALGCSSDVTLLNKYLTASITPGSGIQGQDALAVFQAVLAGNPNNVNIALDFLIDNFDDVSSNYGGRSLSRVVEGIADRITNVFQIAKFRVFIETNRENLKDAAEAADLAVANALVNIEWMTLYRDNILDWLKRERGSASSIKISVATLIISLSLYFVH